MLMKAREMMAKVVLRPLEKTDYQAWYQGFAKRLASQSPYDKGYLDLTACDEAWFEELVHRHRDLANSHKQYIYAVFDAETGAHVGAVDLVILDKDFLAWAEIGYFVHNHCWRRGYGLAALKALLHMNNQTLRFHRLEAHVLVDNEASKALLEKSGFDYEGRRKAFLNEPSGWEDADIYVWVDETVSTI